MTDDILKARLVDAATALFGAKSAASFIVPIPNTRPQLFVAVGDAKQLAAFAAAQLGKGENGEAVTAEPV
jgi:hypothetical protein